MQTTRVVLIALVLSARASADVRIVETTVVKAGDRVARGTRSTYIKGVRMRIEVVQADQSATTVYDLPAGVTLALDAPRRRAESRAIEARAAELEKQYPRARTEIKLTPSGATKELAGASCAEHTVS